MSADVIPARSLPEVCQATRQANCGHCWQRPGLPCTTSETGADGYHVARLGRACRRGLISDEELAAVLHDVTPFTSATAVYERGGRS